MLQAIHNNMNKYGRAFRAMEPTLTPILTVKKICLFCGKKFSTEVEQGDNEAEKGAEEGDHGYGGVEVKPLLETTFRPLIPDSPILLRTLSSEFASDNNLLKLSVAIGLFAESIFREIASVSLSLGLHIYALLDENNAALYKVRLNINRYRPIMALINSIF